MKLKFLLFALAALAVTTAGFAADSVQARCILVAASNQKRESDPRLAQYEPTLRRVLRFESYRFVGSGGARADAPGEATMALGQGHRIVLDVESVKGDQIRARVSWIEGGRTLMNTVLVLRRGVPAVLGGPARGGEVLAVILIAS
ncbi:MAG TPA: hypothetical protein VIK52_14135 [Opitutaceae bacterium]